MIIPGGLKKLIEDKTGCDIDIIGTKKIESALTQSLADMQIEDVTAYVRLIQRDYSRFLELIDKIVVPKTWFFRNKASYLYIKSRLIPSLKREGFTQPLKVLSFPCSTGEEPYSIAATLLASNLSSQQFVIDAMDICNTSLDIAKKGVYDFRSTTIEDVGYSQLYLTESGEKISVDGELKESVRFFRKNILNTAELEGFSGYDIVFCRNMFIYFVDKAKKKAINQLQRMMKKNGILFTGHAELNYFNHNGFNRLKDFGIFACALDNQPTVARQRTAADFKKKGVSKKRIPDVASTKVLPPKRSIHKDIPTSSVDNPPTDTAHHPLDLTQLEALSNAGEYEKAIQLCDRILDKNGAEPKIHYMKGVILGTQNNFDLAQKSIEKALYLDPEYYDALIHLSLLFEKKGDGERARIFRQRAVRVFDKNSNNSIGMNR